LNDGYVIKTENLTKYYRDVKALESLNLEVKSGIFGFLGPNAAGKTTTIKILVGLVKPTSGKAYVMGFDAVEESLEIRKRVGYLPESPVFYEELSGWEYLDFIGRLKGLKKEQRKTEIRTLLEKVGLLEQSKRKIKGYSAGMLQRLGFAQALLGDPDLLILDEPTSNLDPLGREDVIRLIKDLGAEGKKIFISSHILSEVERVCEEVAILDNGRLIMQEKIETLRAKYPKASLQEIFVDMIKKQKVN